MKLAVRPFHLPGSYLVLELTNRCNLRCRHCARSSVQHAHYARVGDFPRAGVESLLEDLERVRARFDNLILFWLGEPLCHPEFVPIYDAIVSMPGIEEVFQQVEVHTNGTLLDRTIAAGIINRFPVPQRWHISLDAATAGTYQRTKGVDALARVEANVERLLRFRQKGGFPWPRVVVQCIISDRNEREAEAFLAHWQARFRRYAVEPKPLAYHVPATHSGDAVFFRALDCPTAEEQRRQDAVYARVVDRLGLGAPGRDDREVAGDAPCGAGAGDGSSRPCSGFWKSPVIGWDGRLTTCTRDSLFHNLVGNVLETPLSALWFGDTRLSGWRREVSRGDYRSLALCRNCFIPGSHNYTGITGDEIAAAEAASHG